MDYFTVSERSVTTNGASTGQGSGANSLPGVSTSARLVPNKRALPILVSDIGALQHIGRIILPDFCTITLGPYYQTPHKSTRRSETYANDEDRAPDLCRDRGVRG